MPKCPISNFYKTKKSALVPVINVISKSWVNVPRKRKRIEAPDQETTDDQQCGCLSKPDLEMNECCNFIKDLLGIIDPMEEDPPENLNDVTLEEDDWIELIKNFEERNSQEDMEVDQKYTKKVRRIKNIPYKKESVKQREKS